MQHLVVNLRVRVLLQVVNLLQAFGLFNEQRKLVHSAVALGESLTSLQNVFQAFQSDHYEAHVGCFEELAKRWDAAELYKVSMKQNKTKQ